ncbi:MAG: TonB-dependent receptor [Nocardioides sp.]
MLYPPEIARGRQARAVSGTYPPLQALRRMLQGTGLDARRTRAGVLVVSRAPSPPSEPTKVAPPPRAEKRPIALPQPEIEDDIVVTARRREEALENVPQTVNAVTGEQLRSLALHVFEDVPNVVAGLFLSSGASGVSNTASMRGVTFATETAASPTVEFYLNDIPVSSSFVFQPLFDAGQLEVLRGPQGTLRGRAAPSGAITLTTRQPDLDEPGGYANATGTLHGNVNAQAAVGLPILRDRLALRIAGVIDRDDYDGVFSLNSPAPPRQHSWGLRGTLRFDPGEDLSTTLMAQHVVNSIWSYSQLAGEGSPGAAPTDTGYALPAAIAAGYNGPVLRPEDRSGLSENQRRMTERQTLVTALAVWRFADQKLAYSGSYARSRRRTLAPADDADQLPGYDLDLLTATLSRYWTHELKLESETRVAGLFKYVVGAFHTRRATDALSERGPTYGPGAFGSPLGAPSLSAPVVARYAVATAISRLRDETESSLFGNLTVYLGERTELAAGARYIVAKRDNLTRFLRDAGGFRLEPASSVLCLGQMASALYAGFCDVPVAAGQLGAPLVERGTRRPVIYSIQLSHRFDEALMIYGNYGTSWRDGPGIVGITNGGIGRDGGAGDPLLRRLANASPETSHSFEIGLKAVLFDRRLRLNAAVYRQKFDGLIYRGPPTAYLVDNGFSAPSVGRFSFTSNVDALVRGVELELSARATPRLSLAGAFSYADGRVQNDFVPCNDGNFDGVPDNIAPSPADFAAAGQKVALCLSNRSVTRSPRWSLTLQSEYRVPVARGVSAYARSLLTHFPRNANDNETAPIRAYSTVNLYAGLTGEAGWDISLFVRNAFDTAHLVSRDSVSAQSEANLGTYFGSSGYYAVRVVTPRQIGLNLRYAFGVDR